jgi:Ca2+-transporting ATPase
VSCWSRLFVCQANAVVLRDGKESTIDAAHLVPGDIVKVSQGSKVPADMRVLALNTTTLGADQSQLTGEADSVRKEADELSLQDAVVQDQTNMLFSSSAITYGSAYGVVTATGMSAEIGKIQKSITDVEEEMTPLTAKLNEFGDTLTNVIFYICVLVWVVNYSHFITWGEDGKMVFSFEKCVYYFKIAVALAVAAIPEGLPAVITTCLALGTRKMAQKNAIVRKLPSVETLGCCSVICSDKTGTLTTNEMTVRKFWLFKDTQTKGRDFDVEGSSYDPAGAIHPAPLAYPPPPVRSPSPPVPTVERERERDDDVCL